MRLPEDKAGLTVSAVAHAGLLLWGLISFSARPLEAAPTPTLPVDIISDKQFSELSSGAKNAPKSETPKPLVDKIGPAKPADEVTSKINDKREVKTVSAPPPSEAQPEKAEAKPEKPPEKKPPKVDPIAEALKKEDTRKKREEAKKQAELKKQEQQPRFDPTQIAALLDKRDPQRNSATGETLSQAPSLGYANAPSAQLSQSEIDALRRRLSECWNPPVGAANAPNLKVVFRVLFKKDGSLAGDPAMVAGTASPFGPAMAESAKRALLTCQPFKMLRPENYNSWRDIEITFDPREMFGG